MSDCGLQHLPQSDDLVVEVCCGPVACFGLPVVLVPDAADVDGHPMDPIFLHLAGRYVGNS